jgi:tRNA 5-methylaminomethyl-2-thiouridine biosynthesis bifunctional protein
MNEGRIVDALSLAWSGQSHQTVLDTEFSQGLLFLTLWQAWRQKTNRPKRLHVIGLLPALPERIALQNALQTKLQSYGGKQLLPLLHSLLAVWPLSLPGLHRLEFESGDVSLTLGVGPIDIVLGRLCARVDRFVLSDVSLLPLACRLAADGSQAVISIQLGDISKSQTSPLRVVPVTPSQPSRVAADDPWLRSHVAPAAQHALVVGAGFAGMGVAQSLALRGWRVTVIDPDWGQNASAHQQHAAAALTPMVSKDDNIRARLSRAGSLRAQSRWGELPQSILHQCGALQLQRQQGRTVDLSAVLDALQFPRQWAEFVSAEQASELAGMPLGRGGIYFPTAVRVSPPGLLNALAQTPGIKMQAGQAHHISNISGVWQVLDPFGKVLASASHVVLAAGFHTQTVLKQSGLLKENARLAEMHALGGEVSFIPSGDLAGGPRCIVSGDGYVLPAFEGHCVIGSTYAHAAKEVSVTPEGIAGNINRAAGLLSIPMLSEYFKARQVGGWAGWRAVLPGRLPAIGPVLHAPGVWVACGFASRGLTWATLAGDLIAGALNGEPLVLENDIIGAISDN